MKALIMTALVVTVVTACSARQRNAAGLAMSAGLLAVDACQTTTSAARGWDGYSETGLARHALGAKPDARTVGVYFAVTSIVALGAALIVPERHRWIAYTAIGSVQASAVRNNYETTRCLGVGRG
jgi:hypothetical protein